MSFRQQRILSGCSLRKTSYERKTLQKRNSDIADCSVAALIIGYSLDILNITPIIRKLQHPHLFLPAEDGPFWLSAFAIG